MPVDMPPAWVAQAEVPPAPIFPGPDGSPQYLIGLNAYGAANDLDRLAKAAAVNGWPSQRDPNSADGPKLIIAFPKANASEVAGFLRRAVAGEYGKFRFESAMAPVRPSKP
jgi:hypothetical protein